MKLIKTNIMTTIMKNTNPFWLIFLLISVVSFTACEPTLEERVAAKPSLNIQLFSLTGDTLKPKQSVEGVRYPVYENLNFGEAIVVKVKAKSNVISGYTLRNFQVSRYSNLANIYVTNDASVSVDADSLLDRVTQHDFEYDYHLTIGYGTQKITRYCFTMVDNNGERVDYTFDIDATNNGVTTVPASGGVFKQNFTMGAQKNRLYGHLYNAETHRIYMWDWITDGRSVGAASAASQSQANTNQTKVNFVYIWKNDSAFFVAPSETSFQSVEFLGRGATVANNNKFISTWNTKNTTTFLSLSGTTLNYDNIIYPNTSVSGFTTELDKIVTGTTKFSTLLKATTAPKKIYVKENDVIAYRMNNTSSSARSIGFIKVLKIEPGVNGYINFEVKSGFSSGFSSY
jgi:hypothetical protein